MTECSPANAATQQRRSRSAASARGRQLWNDHRGNVAILVAVGMLGIVVAAGSGIDIARTASARNDLQGAADAAALAGTSIYTSAGQAANAKASAEAYFDKYAKGLGMTVTSRTATATTSGSGSSSSFRVTMDVNATVPTTFAKAAGVANVNMVVKSVAASTPAQPIAPARADSGTPSQVLAGSLPTSDAADWNSMYMYGVPNGSGGTPDYTKFPSLSQFYEVGSTCNGNTNKNWTPQSQCNAGFGAKAPVNLNYYIPPDQPIAFMFVNMTSGMSPAGQGYSPNKYGAKSGYYNLMTTATMSLGQPPTQITDNTSVIVRGLTGFSLAQSGTTYSTAGGSSGLNCTVQIQLVDPKNLPTSPPYPGQCLAANDPRSGYQYANLSCNQINGRSFMYWWNDMGGPSDDYDYNDYVFVLTCLSGTTNPDGGTIASGQSPQGRPATLIQ